MENKSTLRISISGLRIRIRWISIWHNSLLEPDQSPVADTEKNQTICNRFLRLTCSFLIYQIIHCVHLDVLKVMLFLVKSSSSKYCFGEQLNNEIIRLAHSSKNKLNVNTLKLSRRHSDSKNIKYTVNTTPNKFTHILMVLK